MFGRDGGNGKGRWTDNCFPPPVKDAPMVLNLNDVDEPPPVRLSPFFGKVHPFMLKTDIVLLEIEILLPAVSASCFPFQVLFSVSVTTRWVVSSDNSERAEGTVGCPVRSLYCPVVATRARLDASAFSAASMR